MKDKTTDKMTVGRMKSILAKYDNNSIIYVYGGENEYGDFGIVQIAKDEEDYRDFLGKVILEYCY